MFNITTEKYQTQLNYAKSKDTKPEILTSLIYSAYLQIRNAVASNPMADASILEKLYENMNTSPLLIAQNPNAPARLLYKIAVEHHDSPEICESITQHPNCSISTLSRLAESPFTNVRVAVASHECTPPHVLESLAEKVDCSVNIAVVHNPSVTSSILNNIAYKQGFRDPLVIDAVAGNIKTPPDAIRHIYDDYKNSTLPFAGTILNSIAENIGTPADILKEMERSDNESVKVRATINLDTPRNVKDAIYGTAAGREHNEVNPYYLSKFLKGDIIEMAIYDVAGGIAEITDNNIQNETLSIKWLLSTPCYSCQSPIEEGEEMKNIEYDLIAYITLAREEDIEKLNIPDNRNEPIDPMKAIKEARIKASKTSETKEDNDLKKSDIERK